MLKKILSILMFTMIATTTIVRAELWLPDSDDSDEELLINDPVTDTQVTVSPMKTVASKAYVDTQIETKQLKIPAAGQPNVGAGETVMTYTATGNGQIGERGLYSDISSYDANTDADKLITASALNATFTNLPTTPTTKLECANQADGCTLWTIVDQTAYARGLPAGYTRLEYIQSTGTQYIDTGVYPTNNTAIDVKFVNIAPQGESTTRVVIGDGYQSGRLYLLSITAVSNSNVVIGGLSKILSNYWTRNTPFTVHMDTNGININNSIINWTGTATTFTGTRPLTMFGVTDAQTRYAQIKMYYLKITANGELVRDFIPAKNSNNVIGMYDTVSGTFFTNAGGNDNFVAGPAAN